MEAPGKDERDPFPAMERSNRANRNIIPLTEWIMSEDQAPYPIRYVIIVTGDELITGRRADAHIPFLTKTLNALGLECSHCLLAGDASPRLAQMIRRALEEAPLVIVTGGLGPTVDDITREAISEATGIPLVENPEALRQLKARFRAFHRPMTGNNRRQALSPAQGGYFPNPNGTAPGLYFDDGNRLVIALPGPPRELVPMVLDQLVPFLQDRFHPCQTRLFSRLQIACLGESNIDQTIRQYLGAYPDLAVASLSRPGEVELTLSLPAGSPEAQTQLARCVEIIRREMGEFIFSESDESLAAVTGRLLRERGETVAVAESCTGGLLGSWITTVPGASDYFTGGVTAYSNAVKEQVLNVSPATLRNQGAVSRETACEMAVGVRRLLRASWSISLTGIAGPGGGTKDKPVGTVWIAVCGAGDETYPLLLTAPGSREMIRRRACVYALDQLRRLLLELPLHR